MDNYISRFAINGLIETGGTLEYKSNHHYSLRGTIFAGEIHFRLKLNQFRPINIDEFSNTSSVLRSIDLENHELWLLSYSMINLCTNPQSSSKISKYILLYSKGIEIDPQANIDINSMFSTNIRTSPPDFTCNPKITYNTFLIYRLRKNTDPSVCSIGSHADIESIAMI